MFLFCNKNILLGVSSTNFIIHRACNARLSPPRNFQKSDRFLKLSGATCATFLDVKSSGRIWRRKCERVWTTAEEGSVRRTTDEPSSSVHNEVLANSVVARACKRLRRCSRAYATHNRACDPKIHALCLEHESDFEISNPPPSSLKKLFNVNFFFLSSLSTKFLF